MLVDIIAFFPFELIFVPFFQNCKITLQKHKAYFATTRMSRYQKPNWAFFLLFSLTKKNIENTNIPLFQGHNVFPPAVQSRGFVQPRSKGDEFSTSRDSNMIPSASPHCSFLYRNGSAGIQCIRPVLCTRLHAVISLVLLFSLSKVTLSLKRKV